MGALAKLGPLAESAHDARPQHGRHDKRHIAVKVRRERRKLVERLEEESGAGAGQRSDEDRPAAANVVEVGVEQRALRVRRGQLDRRCRKGDAMDHAIEERVVQF